MKICVITGNRAEYGLLKRLIQLILNDKFLELLLIVTGDHLNDINGTIKEIENDNLKIDAKIQCSPSQDSPLEILTAMGSATIELAKFLDFKKPDCIFILGDRYEMLVVAYNAHIFKIPLLHISGGEITEGSLDDTIRHAITKFSDYHFVAIEEFKKRVIQMGEDPSKVFVVGGMGIDAIKNIKLLKLSEVIKKLKIKNQELPIILCTYHPVTAEESSTEECIAILDALAKLKRVNIVITFPNSDYESEKILKRIKNFVFNKENAYLFNSLGQILYLSTLKISSCIIGNSSSGITEAPYFGVKTINIGSRQKGRPRCPSIVDVNPESELIYHEIEKSFLSDKKTFSTYGKSGASEEILQFLLKNKENLVKKKGFFDLNL